MLATFFVSDTLCLSLVVAKLVMNEVRPWSLLDSTCGRIWWNVDDIQRPVVLGFAIFIPSDWLHPVTNFQSYGLVCSLRLPRLSLGMPACVWLIATLVACHTFLATWSTCHRLNFLPNLATLVVAILLATFFVADNTLPKLSCGKVSHE